MDELAKQMNNYIDDEVSEGDQTCDDQVEYANMDQLRAHPQYLTQQPGYPPHHLVPSNDPSAYEQWCGVPIGSEGMGAASLPVAGNDMMAVTAGPISDSHFFMGNEKRQPVESSHRETSLSDSTISSLHLSISDPAESPGTQTTQQAIIPLIIPSDPSHQSSEGGGAVSQRPNSHVTLIGTDPLSAPYIEVSVVCII